ncbi:MAG: GNAT family N-acetyltransferase [Deltaproteobacteria bacterium]|nr:GNAT family N-acetyltransferase [Deltaproteobacteria bacterium]
MEISTPISDFKIRKASFADVSLILSFIKELAEYEKLSHEVVATEEALKETLFGKHPSAEVVHGYYRNVPVAFAVFFHNYSTFLGKPGLYLEDLFVKPEMRGKGFGKVMLSYLAHLARERGCGRFEWWVLDWNEPAIKFYNSIGAKPMDEWTVQRVDGESLDRLASQFNAGR